MIGTIRKHSVWLWWFIAIVVVISFTMWGIPSSVRNSGSPATGDYGSLYGHKITAQEYANAKNEFDLFYWFHNFEWPKSMAQKDMDQQIYLRLLLMRKAEALGIHVNDAQAGEAAAAMLNSLGRNDEHVSMDAFEQQVLKPNGLTSDDFERFVRSDLIIQQLIQAIGLTGELITPQEAQDIYEREHQEIQAQAVFFSTSNYLSQISVTPAEVGQFYTNYMAEYRLPDRVQISYVFFNLTNYLATAEQKTGKTNLDDQVAAIFNRYGMKAEPTAKTPEEAKAKIRQEVIRREALTDATADANDFATAVFGETPVRAENLAAVAKQKHLTVKTTEPFGEQYGPEEIPASESFIKAAFALTPDDPFAGPLSESDGVYVITLDKSLPSEIPPLDQIRGRVTMDYQNMQATLLAQRIGTNFISTLDSDLAAGKTFSSACATVGLHPENLPPFSMSTTDLPELGNRADIRQIKQAAFTTQTGHASNFEETQDGGFILFVQKQLPVDRSDMTAQLPKFTEQLRASRASDVFNEWIQIEASREFRSVPAFQKEAEAAGLK